MARVAGDPAIDPSEALMTQNSAPTRVPAKVAALGMPGLNDLLSLAVAVVVAALYFVREVPIPITMAVILSVMPAPLVTSLQHWHVPPVTAVPLVLLVDRWVGAVRMAACPPVCRGVAWAAPGALPSSIQAVERTGKAGSLPGLSCHG